MKTVNLWLRIGVVAALEILRSGKDARGYAEAIAYLELHQAAFIVALANREETSEAADA